MRLNEVTFDDSRPVDGYGPGFFRIAGEVVTGAVIILPSGVTGWGGYDDRARLMDKADEIDVLFIGTGHEGRLEVSEEARTYLQQRAIECEALRTPEAVEAYNDSKQRKAALVHVTC